MDKQIARIQKMENILGEATEALQGLNREVERYLLLREKIAELEQYYTGGQWRKDFEDDEAGKLPQELKRGVLSEDGVDDFLDLQDAVLKKIKKELQLIC